MAEITQETVSAIAGKAYDTAGDYAAYNSCDLRESVKDSEASIRRDIAVAEGQVQRTVQSLQNFEAAQFTHVGEKACDAEKEAIKAQYEGKLQTLASASNTDRGIVDVGRALDNKLDGFERNVDVRFADNALNVLKEASATREAVSAGFAAAALSAAKDAASLALAQANGTASILAKLCECCCETKLGQADLKLSQSEGFARLSDQHVRQLLSEAKDELAEARFDRVYDKVSSGSSSGNGHS